MQSSFQAAEKLYVELLAREEADDLNYFERFKMALAPGRARMEAQLAGSDVAVVSVSGRKFSGRTVFSAVLKRLAEAARAKMLTGEELPIKWVLSVPAIWDDFGLDFMRTCAVQAGARERAPLYVHARAREAVYDVSVLLFYQHACVTHASLTLRTLRRASPLCAGIVRSYPEAVANVALVAEPEAAALFCVRYPRHAFGDTDIPKFDVHTRFMVVDAGGACTHS